MQRDANLTAEVGRQGNEVLKHVGAAPGDLQCLADRVLQLLLERVELERLLSHCFASRSDQPGHVLRQPNVVISGLILHDHRFRGDFLLHLVEKRAAADEEVPDPLSLVQHSDEHASTFDEFG
jgi:hypothetical protein